MAVWTASSVAQPTSRTASATPLVGLSIAHAAALLLIPSVPVVAVGLWWSANTVAHNFIHRPFFRSRAMNRAYSAYLSVVLGLPQRLWRDRHLAHHGGRSAPVRWSAQLALEIALVLALWTTMIVIAPRSFLTVYLPGWILGLALCHLHGHYEHVRGTTSHYGRLYNFLFFNDGYHVEHHQRPYADWRSLSTTAPVDARPSRWPPVLRWLESVDRPRQRASRLIQSFLTGLERIVLRSPRLQEWIVSRHERAFRHVLAEHHDIGRVLVVGGGLFPRTARVLARVAPNAEITIVDGCRDHLATAAALLSPTRVAFVHDRFDPAQHCDADLVVVPLAFEGSRRVVYDHPPARLVLVHDWIWNRRGRSAVVSWRLCKRLNLVERRG